MKPTSLPIPIDFAPLSVNHESGAAGEGELETFAKTVNFALLMLECRREHFPPNEFSDPQWHMISMLFVARHLQGREALMTKELLQVSGLPQGSAWRHLKDLERKGVVASSKENNDNRRSMISLSPTYSKMVDKVCRSFTSRYLDTANKPRSGFDD